MSDAIPGSCFGDKAFDVWRDAHAFFTKRATAYDSDVFNARFMLKTTTFVGSHRHVSQMLGEHDDHFDDGYAEFFIHLFGDVLMFKNGEARESLHRKLCHAFASPLKDDDGAAADKLRSRFTSHLKTLTDPTSPSHAPSPTVYAMFKRFISEYLVCTVLGINAEDTTKVNEIVRLATNHWHGLISLPISLRGFGFSSGNAKAVDARQQLTTIAEAQYATRGIQETQNGEEELHYVYDKVRVTEFESDEEKLDHIVLLLTALVPKAAASLLTSFVIHAPLWLPVCKHAAPNNTPPHGTQYAHDICSECALKTLGDNFEEIWKETCRLWPPFYGGRRISNKDVPMTPYNIPSKHPTIYVTRAAHRDGVVFPKPNTFDYKRWHAKDGEPTPQLFTFGHGRRACVGGQLMAHMAEVLLTTLFSTHSVTVSSKEMLARHSNMQERNTGDVQDVEQMHFVYKAVPVSRPKYDVELHLRPRKERL